MLGLLGPEVELPTGRLMIFGFFHPWLRRRSFPRLASGRRFVCYLWLGRLLLLLICVDARVHKGRLS